MTRNITQYESAYLADYGFESVMVAYRRRMLLERLTIHAPQTVVEIGCGSELLYQHYLAQNRHVEQWIIVEPAMQFSKTASAANLPNLYVINAFFEDAVGKIKSLMTKPPDMIICSSVLHEVPDVYCLLHNIVDIMGERSLLHVNVPNAKSFHRRLARAMGIISNLKTLSERNISLQQNRVYDREALESELRSVGLEVIETGGYMIKPFTHKQMQSITAALDSTVLDGLYKLGQEAPEWASEIFAEARKA